MRKNLYILLFLIFGFSISSSTSTTFGKETIRSEDVQYSASSSDQQADSTSSTFTKNPIAAKDETASKTSTATGEKVNRFGSFPLIPRTKNPVAESTTTAAPQLFTAETTESQIPKKITYSIVPTSTSSDSTGSPFFLPFIDVTETPTLQTTSSQIPTGTTTPQSTSGTTQQPTTATSQESTTTTTWQSSTTTQNTTSTQNTTTTQGSTTTTTPPITYLGLWDFEPNTIGLYNQTDLEADFGTAVKFPGSTYDDQNQTSIMTDPADPSNQTLAYNLYYNPAAGETPWEGTFKAPITPTNELTLEYDVKFDDPTAVPQGGKLWGICGKGTHWDCPGGGNNTDGTRGTSHRVNWDARGTCTLYSYHGQMTYPFGQNTYCFPNDPNPPQLTDGNWHNIKLHVKLNTITNGTPNPDGEVTLYLDGQLAAQRTNEIMVHINSPLQYIWNSSMQEQTNSPRQQTIHYDNIKTY